MSWFLFILVLPPFSLCFEFLFIIIHVPNSFRFSLTWWRIFGPKPVMSIALPLFFFEILTLPILKLVLSMLGFEFANHCSRIELFLTRNASQWMAGTRGKTRRGEPGPSVHDGHGIVSGGLSSQSQIIVVQLRPNKFSHCKVANGDYWPLDTLPLWWLLLPHYLPIWIATTSKH